MTEMSEEFKDIGTELIDEYFPKGKCKKRGLATVFYANLLIKVQKWHLVEIKKAELRAKIVEALEAKINFMALAEERITELQSELRKMEEDNE